MEILIDYNPRYAGIELIPAENTPIYEQVARDTRTVGVQEVGTEGDVLFLQAKRLGGKMVGKTTEVSTMYVEDGHVAVQVVSLNQADREEFYKKLTALEQAAQ